MALLGFGTGPAVAQPGAPSGEATVGEASRDGDARSFTFTFRYAPWEEVLELFAETAGLTLDPGDVPTGTFSYIDRNAYTADEALDVLNGYLMPRGYALVRRDDFLVTLDLTKEIPPNLVPNVSVEDLPSQPRNSLVSVVIPLAGEKADPRRTAAELGSMVGVYGLADPLSTANAIVVRTTATNAERIARWLTRSRDFDPDEMTFVAFQLEHITSAEAALLVGEQLGIVTAPKNVSHALNNTSLDAGPPDTHFVQQGKPSDEERRRAEAEKKRQEEAKKRQRAIEEAQRKSESTEEKRRNEARKEQAKGNSKVRITADTRTNRLFVTTTFVNLIRTDQILAAIDVPPADGYEPLANSKPYLRAYKVHNVKAVEAAKTLSAIDPNMVINEDGWQEYLHIWGDDALHARATEYIRELDRTEGISLELTVIPLARMDPLAAATTIHAMFAPDGDEAPTVEADLYGRRLLVRGTTDQTAQIRTLLADLGEDGSGTVQQGPAGAGSVRTILLQGRDPEELLPLLEQLWNAANDETIRLVPSDRPAVRRRYNPDQEQRLLRGDSSPTTSLRPSGNGSREPTPLGATRLRPRIESPLATGIE